MDLAEPNDRVTHAILEAERLAPDSLEAWAAFRVVSKLEEAIAELSGVDDLPADIARVGAVTAALSAEEPLRAIRLAERYIAASASDATKAQLQQCRDEAEKRLAAMRVPTVPLIKYELRAA